ncbi:MAG: hypothetical protein GXP31_10705 [Kiritimatiellaeota bacterium]|nr:hypothetical protein [Kiritimatiellota bacterium]
MNDSEHVFSVGGWEVRFFPETAGLELFHRDGGGVRISGVLRFETPGPDGQTEAWPIVQSRDGIRNRLALRDSRGDVQGYLRFTGRDGELELMVLHRAALAFSGRLAFNGTATLDTAAFACRTRPPRKPQVLQMASGPADSALNDSVFAPAKDVTLRFGGDSVRIDTRPPTNERGPSVFELELTARPEEPAGATLCFQVISDFYRDRYVPYYRPVDKKRCPSPPTGWMSWNVYFDQAGERENLAEAEAGRDLLQPFGLEFWSIESWQENSGKLPVSSFHNLNMAPHREQFPHGMKWLADRIRELGFRPGIWTVPFGTGNGAFYEAHRDWFLHDAEGAPLQNWCGRYVLDPTQEEVRSHMRETHRTMAQGWGYEFFKIDGMSGRGAGYSAHFYEREDVKTAFRHPCPQPFELCVRALREGIGPNRVFLACQGHYTGPEVERADASRIGGDIVAPNQPSRWHNILSQARSTMNQLFVHNIIWYNDPDTLLVGAYRPLDEARTTTTVVALPGQVMFAGDKLRELPPDRVRLLQQTLPVCDVHPLDMFPVYSMVPIWTLKVRRPFGDWDVTSVFNWSDEPVHIASAFTELGLPRDGRFLVYDFWEKKFLGRCDTCIELDVPAHANRLLCIHPDLDRPQFLSTDRHITQGGISLKSLQWDNETTRLSGCTALVGGFAAELVFHVPPDYDFRSAEATVPLESTTSEGSGLVRLVLRGDATGDAEWRLAFRRR